MEISRMGTRTLLTHSISVGTLQRNRTVTPCAKIYVISFKLLCPYVMKYGINMCIHPDDPPFPVLGLPRIVTCEEDIAWILHAVNNPHNGLTFCAGSLSAGLHNNVPALARMFAHRTHFVHLRSTNAFPNGNSLKPPIWEAVLISSNLSVSLRKSVRAFPCV